MNSKGKIIGKEGTYQFGDLKVEHSELGIDIFDCKGDKICFFNKKGSKALANFIISNQNESFEGIQGQIGINSELANAIYKLTDINTEGWKIIPPTHIIHDESVFEKIVKVLSKCMHGTWQWETPNERLIEMLMREVGYYPFSSEDEMIKNTQIDENLYAKSREVIPTRPSKTEGSSQEVKN